MSGEPKSEIDITAEAFQARSRRNQRVRDAAAARLAALRRAKP